MAPDGTTIELISISSASSPADVGNWLLPRWPNGRTRSALGNPRGWVRTEADLAALGITWADCTPIA